LSILVIAQKHGTYRELSPGEYAGPCPKCGGALRLRIWTEKQKFQCNSCAVEGGVEEFGALFGVASDPIPMRIIEGREVWFARTPHEWRQLVAEGKIVFGPKETRIMADAPCELPPAGLLLDIKAVFPGAYIEGIEKI
jgi:ssDNA-binding Zn-finger/Zn-ribbon topoisomerase 1